MLARLLDNWPYKLLAIAIAIVLRVYVGNATNPQTTKQLTVPINITNVPPGLVPTQSTPDVTISFSGPPDLIGTLSASDIQASVNLDRAHEGDNTALPITVGLTSILRDQVQKDSMAPTGAEVYLDSKGHIIMSVHADFSGTAPVGYQYQLPTVEPATASVDGPESMLKSISRLVVFADPYSDSLATPTTIDDIGQIVALDNRSAQIDGVTITPAQAHVIIPIRKVGALKSLVISPQIVGSPRYPLRVSEVDVNPEMVVVSGPAPLLSQTSIALTLPVDLSKETDTFTQMVKLDLPAGLTAIQNQPVQVTVHMTTTPATGGTGPGASSHDLRLGLLQ